MSIDDEAMADEAFGNFHIHYGIWGGYARGKLIVYQHVFLPNKIENLSIYISHLLTPDPHGHNKIRNKNKIREDSQIDFFMHNVLWTF